MKKSILLVNPAYQYSFFLSSELRKLGWRADVYKPDGFPERLLYSKNYITLRARRNKWARLFSKVLFYIKITMRYKYFLFYGAPLADFFVFNRFYERFLFPVNYSIELSLLKLFNKKFFFFPNGCLQEVLKEDFQEHEEGEVCRNCGWDEGVCNDEKNQITFDILNRYFDYVIANTPIPSVRVRKHLIKERTLDLNIYNPNLEVPQEFLLPPTRNLRILHSFYDENRKHSNKNIKGSPYILAAIERLKKEGHPIEHFFLNKVPLRQMRFYQVQADIVVDQLIYGWWGSAAIEAMALGKPVICYLTPLWKKLFLERFPEYASLPIVEANTENIYEVLKKLVIDKEYRKRKGKEARLFAENHFDVKKNVFELEKIFLNL
jgi:hypothetical protein